ncbi:MAG: AMP-binding protein, partial [Actinomycetes bacterium]
MEGDFLLESSAAAPDDVAVDDGTTRLTWSGLESRARRVARALAASGVTADAPWAILSHNRTEWVEMFLGNTMAGSRYVPLNWHLTAPELAYLLVNSGATLIVTEQGLEPVAGDAAAQAGLDPARILVIGSTYEAWRDAH